VMPGGPLGAKARRGEFDHPSSQKKEEIPSWKGENQVLYRQCGKKNVEERDQNSRKKPSLS